MSTDFECRFDWNFTLRSRTVVNTVPRIDLDTESNVLLLWNCQIQNVGILWKSVENKCRVYLFGKKTITWTILFTKTILEIKEMKNNYMYMHTNNDETKGHGQVTIK